MSDGSRGCFKFGCFGCLTVIGLGVGIVLCRKPQLSPILAPIYAVVEGVFLGSLITNLSLPGTPWFSGLGIAVGNTGEALCLVN